MSWLIDNVSLPTLMSRKNGGPHLYEENDNSFILKQADIFSCFGLDMNTLLTSHHFVQQRINWVFTFSFGVG